MTVLDQLFPTPVAGALQSVSLLFTASQLALGALHPPFRTQLGPAPVAAGAVASGLDIVTFDATLQETQTFTSEVTEHPVEQGADITDHVRPKPIELRIQGIITETPLDDSLIMAAAKAVPGLGLLASSAFTLNSMLSNSGVVRGAFNSLRAIRDSGQPITVSTKYRSYSSMVITELAFTRDQHTGDAMAISLSLREVLTVSSAVTTIQLPTMAQGALDMGTQATTGAGATVTKNASTLYTGINTGTGGGLDAAKAWMSTL